MKPVRISRRETGLIEGQCEHGVGHPLYASADWIARQVTHGDLDETRGAWLTHGCDGCCQDTEWQIATLMESVEKANQIILDHKKLLREMGS